MEDLQAHLSTSSLSSPCSSNLHPLPKEDWLIAEQRTQEILCTIQPTVVSEQRRKEVIEYIQSLIRDYYGIEVFPFGSVPLKTYLPDGDIDLTALSHQNLEEGLASDICSILESEEQQGTEFQVKEVQYIHAQVKIVKCIVQNIAVDISFNQLAGLSALCFLEHVDQLIGKDHLFKRSLILIKAWCYYESRILGAHHGLISTYALETLVLYIVNLFHSSLHGPLSVLYRFLDYYSTFDWDHYCVSLIGPVPIASLSEILVETPEIDGGDLLLEKEFLQNCSEMFAAPTPTRALETRGHEFPVKHLNIVDPLKDNNNLGRSVNKGNFHRIRCALSYGALKLGGILTLPGERMAEELKKFFMNTLDRNGIGQRPDVQVPVPVFDAGRSVVSDLRGDYENYFSGLQYSQWYHGYTIPGHIQPNPSSPSHIQNNTSWDNALYQLLQFNQNLSQRSTNAFTQSQPFYHPNAPQLSIANFGIEETIISRGTGTYIPDMAVVEKAKSRGTGPSFTRTGFEERMTPLGTGTCVPDMANRSNRDTHLWVKKDPEFLSHGPPLKHPQNIDQIEVPSKTGRNGNSNCLDLSLEQFPLLSGVKRPLRSENRKSGQPNLKSPQVKVSSPSLESIEFGNCGHSPSSLELPPLEANKQPDSDALTTPLLEASKQPDSGASIVPSLEARKQPNSDALTTPLEASKQPNSGALATPLEARKHPHSGDLTTLSLEARKQPDSGALTTPPLEASKQPDFGALTTPPLAASKQPDSGALTTVDTVQNVQTMVNQKPEELSERHDERVLVKSYKLGYEKDFPTLPIQKPKSECVDEKVSVNPYKLEDEKDFPPLVGMQESCSYKQKDETTVKKRGG